MSFEMDVTWSCGFWGCEVIGDSGRWFWSEVTRGGSGRLLDEEIYGYPDDADDVQ